LKSNAHLLYDPSVGVADELEDEVVRLTPFQVCLFIVLYQTTEPQQSQDQCIFLVSYFLAAFLSSLWELVSSRAISPALRFLPLRPVGTTSWSGNASLIGAQIGAGDWRRSCRGVPRVVGLSLVGLVLWASSCSNSFWHPFGPTSTLGVLNVDPNWTAEATETTHSIWQSCHWVYGPTLS
jgi:hypothetical protein